MSPDAPPALRVKAFLPYPIGRVPGQRYRIEQWAPRLRAQGIEVVYSSFLGAATMDVLYRHGFLWEKFRGTADGYLRAMRESAHLDGFDVAYIYREATLLSGTFVERRIARRLPVLFDFDDAIYLRDVSPANRTFGWLKSAAKAQALCRLSAAVVVGNQHLAEFARRFNSSIAIVPSSIDTSSYCPQTGKRDPSPRPVIGWMGSATTQRYLEEFAPVLRKIAARRPIEIRVVSDRPPQVEGVDVTWRLWTAEREAAEIAEFDVGIMPLPDDPWTRGKCAMKALQYMGMGVPVVCSPVGANRDLVRHGENGLLATTADEWDESVEALLADGSLRARLGHAGRLTVEREYSASVSADRFAAIVRSVASRRFEEGPLSRSDLPALA
jgi:glycosyltransferase involved in cell wall biosynthesis